MKLFRSNRPVALELATPGREVRVYQSQTAEILEAPEPFQARITLLAVLALVASLLLIALCMRVDRIVSSSSGEIVTTDPTAVLGALDQSIIRSINVREGDKVTKGQVLATLDPTFATADLGALKAQVASLNAQIARCQAELTQKPFVMAPQADPVANTYITAQRLYYEQRKAQFDAQVHTYDAQIAQYKTTIAKYQSDEARYTDRSKISQEIEKMRAELAAAQVGSRLNLLAATDQKLEIQRALEFDRGAVTESQHELDATIATRNAFVQQWFAQVSQEMVTAQSQLDAAVEQLTKAAKHQDLVQITAPADGLVLKISKLSPQSVLASGDPLIYIAPFESPVEAELHIASRDIAFLRAGQDATIKLYAYNFIDHGAIDGTVRWISEGSFTTDDNGAPTTAYYKVRIALRTVTLRNVPSGFRLVPGITLTGDIHVGTHALFTYLFGGVIQGFDEAMREP
ncbi:MAG TPA: HlyD family type I secretion periplasmic adaptor subunit [Stellaceae bacterium]|nr:HlyD family type I secretion periplasmic adaptor subunit [Stellaceae bacterium]